MNIDRTEPVLVTGATGYVGGWLVKKLLEEGLTVHVPTRYPKAKDKLRHLDELAAASPGSIRYSRADLMKPGSYAEAMRGCELVFHMGSPVFFTAKDPQKELIDPALEGTRNVLQQVNDTPSVKRVVLTSSLAAIYCDAKDCAQAPNGSPLSELRQELPSAEQGCPEAASSALWVLRRPGDDVAMGPRQCGSSLASG